MGNVVIKYGLPEKATVALNLYDISGRLVKSIYSGIKEKGYYEINIKDAELINRRLLHKIRGRQVQSNKETYDIEIVLSSEF